MKPRFFHGLVLILGLSALPARSEPPFFIPPIIEETFQYTEKLEAQHRFADAYQVYNRLIAHGDLPPNVEAMVWYRLGRAQQKNNQPKSAINSLSKAVLLDPKNEDYRVFLAELRGTRYQRQNEKPSMFYGAWRDAGTARRLTQTSGVLHIFVTGRNSRPWTRRERLVTEAQVAEASAWLAHRSADYQVKQTPTFKHAFLILTDEVYWTKMNVPDYKVSSRLREDWVFGIPARFGASSLDELFTRAFHGAAFDNRAIAFHAIKEGRAFAVPSICNSSMDIEWEEAFVHHQEDEINTPGNARVYTHELLHLYGADDLYNKVKDPAIPERDIMYCRADSLDHTIIGSITAYAIGWRSQPPHLTQLQIENPLRR